MTNPGETGVLYTKDARGAAFTRGPQRAASAETGCPMGLEDRGGRGERGNDRRPLLSGGADFNLAADVPTRSTHHLPEHDNLLV